MKINFFNRINTNVNMNIEGIYFYYLYLCAEKMKLNSLIPFDVALLEQIDLFTTSQIITCYYAFSIPDDHEAALKETKKIIELHKNIDAVKRVKHKSKEQIVLIHRGQALERVYKQYLNEYATNALKIINIFDWLELMDEEIVEFGGHLYYNEKSDKEDSLIPEISKSIMGKEEFLLVDGIIGTYIKETALEEPKKEELFSKETKIFSFPLIYILYGKDISKENLAVLRKNVLNKLNGIFAKIDEFKASLHNEEFDDIVKEKTLAFYESLKDERESFQTNIDEHMFIKQVLNSDKDCLRAQLRIGVCSIRTLVNYFEKSKILLPFVANALEKQLEQKMDIDKCDAFIYIKLPEDILKQHIPNYK